MVLAPLLRALPGLICAVATAAPAAAQRTEHTITVTAGAYSHRSTLVTARVERAAQGPATATPRGVRVRLTHDGRAVPAQAEVVGDAVDVTWRVQDLPAGASRDYRIALTPGAAPTPPAAGVLVRRDGANATITLGGRPVATYDVTTGPNKPYVYPLFGPTGQLTVRPLPSASGSGTTVDHPHHRGLWFTHGSVNGVDFWSESRQAGRTVHKEYTALVSGALYGAVRANTEWVGPDGKAIATDSREVRVFEADGATILDVDVIVRPVTGALVFGDTKEGSFGLRVPDSMRLAGGGGHIVNSEGVTEAATWGKRARWVGYYGPVANDTVGVAILDHPENLRHPTYWHVRDYGLFAVNPFGIHDFERGQPDGTGDYTVPEGGSARFRYRVVLHRGTPDQAGIEAAWQSYAHPPTVVVRPAVKGRP